MAMKSTDIVTSFAIGFRFADGSVMRHTVGASNHRAAYARAYKELGEGRVFMCKSKQELTEQELVEFGYAEAPCLPSAALTQHAYLDY